MSRVLIPDNDLDQGDCDHCGIKLVYEYFEVNLSMGCEYICRYCEIHKRVCFDEKCEKYPCKTYYCSLCGNVTFRRWPCKYCKKGYEYRCDEDECWNAEECWEFYAN
jgi:hypothetical protein